MMEEKYSIKLPSDNTKCKTCKFELSFDGKNYHCAKFRFKPSEILYEGEDCPKYEKSEVEMDEEE